MPVQIYNADDTVDLTNRYYYLNGLAIGEQSDHGPSQQDFTSYAAENAQQGRNGIIDRPTMFADFDQGYTPLGPNTLSNIPGTYTVQGGETLQDVARAVWGDSSLWYLIADANGFTGTETLEYGTHLVLPQDVSSIHHSSDTYQVYEPGRAIGDVAPTLPDAPTQFIPDVDDGGGCGIKQIIVVIVAVVVTYFTAGAAAGVFGTALSATGVAGAGTVAVIGGSALTLGQAVAVGMVAAAAGSVASQLTGMALGIQDKFSFKDVGVAAITGGVTAGLGGAFKSLAGDTNLLTKALSNTYTQTAVSNVVIQGVNIALGEQQKFEWRNVAIAVAGKAAGRAVGGAVDSDFRGETSYGEFTSGQGSNTDSFLGVASASFANATTQEAISSEVYGREFNWAGVASSVGQTVVENLVNAAMEKNRQERLEKQGVERNAQTKRFIEDNATHSTLNPDYATTTASEMTPELKDALYVYGRSNNGSQIINHAIENNNTVDFILASGLEDELANGFITDDHSIRYTLDDGWYDADEYSEGQNLSMPTLDVVMAHEIGHTALGRAALGLTNIDSSRSNGKYNIGAEEIRAVELFENPYRAEKGLPLREKAGARSVDLSNIEKSAMEEIDVNSAGVTDKDIRISRRRDGGVDRTNLALAVEKVSQYFSQNPDNMPGYLREKLSFEYEHEIGRVKGEVKGAIQNLLIYRNIDTNEINYTSAKTIKVYMGGATTPESALFNVLHEYGHHSDRAINYSSKGWKNSPLGGLDPVEFSADKWAHETYKKITGRQYE